MKRFLLLALALCLSTQVQAQQILKIATLAPDGSSWMRELRIASKEIETITQGRVLIKFYPGCGGPAQNALGAIARRRADFK